MIFCLLIPPGVYFQKQPDGRAPQNREVIARKHPGAPHRSILIVDATTGQNALQQTKIFKEAAGIDELILTKLDGTAKGGVAVAVSMQYGIPITYVGLGEKMEDLRPFNGDDFAKALLEQ